MLQLYDSLFEASCRLAGAYGPRVALAVLTVTGGVIVLQLLYRFLPRGGPEDGMRRR
jgi:hypothetical protein